MSQLLGGRSFCAVIGAELGRQLLTAPNGTQSRPTTSTRSGKPTIRRERNAQPWHSNPVTLPDMLGVVSYMRSSGQSTRIACRVEDSGDNRSVFSVSHRGNRVGGYQYRFPFPSRSMQATNSKRPQLDLPRPYPSVRSVSDGLPGTRASGSRAEMQRISVFLWVEGSPRLPEI